MDATVIKDWVGEQSVTCKTVLEVLQTLLISALDRGECPTSHFDLMHFSVKSPLFYSSPIGNGVRHCDEDENPSPVGVRNAECQSLQK